ncbi:MAG TPA: hypothetical protein ENJ82_02500 [Bacteroidetes bacterium]|nr:hypothetical protein [Bacteroidota bacterium]
MKVPEIKKLVENADIDVAILRQAEDDLMEEKTLSIEVGGEDEGEQLTHILAAIWILEEMEKTGEDFRTTLRAYTSRVRKSIS